METQADCHAQYQLGIVMGLIQRLNTDPGLALMTMKLLKKHFGLICFASTTAVVFAEPASNWKQLFTGKDLSRWSTYVAPPPGSKTPYGLNNDPRGVFTTSEVDGVRAIHVSGELYGAVTALENFTNFHVRVEFK